jgi:hypothetical protein
VKNPEISLGRSSPRGIGPWRQRHWKGDVVGGLVFLLILVNGSLSSPPCTKPRSPFLTGANRPLFLLSVFLIVGGLACFETAGAAAFPSPPHHGVVGSGQ